MRGLRAQRVRFSVARISATLWTTTARPHEAVPDHARSPRALFNILCPEGLHQQIGATGRDPVLALARMGHTRNEGNKFEINASILVRMGRTGGETRFERGKADSPLRSPPDHAALGRPPHSGPPRVGRGPREGVFRWRAYPPCYGQQPPARRSRA